MVGPLVIATVTRRFAAVGLAGRGNRHRVRRRCGTWRGVKPSRIDRATSRAGATLPRHAALRVPGRIQFVVPVTVAKNCRVEAIPPDGGKNAYAGEILTATVSSTPEIVINALALLPSWLRWSPSPPLDSQWAGGRRHIINFAGVALVGARQGLDACWQICPTVAFPFAIPFTLQLTDVSEVLVTVGVSVTRCPVASDALVGDTLTVTLLTIVIVAARIKPSSVA